MPTRKSAPRRRESASRVPDQILAAVLGQPWLISKAGLETVLAVVSRAEIRPEALEAAAGRELEGTRTVSIRDSVALVPVGGPLVARASFFDAMCGATSYATIARDVGVAVASHEVQSIVLRIASPGGQVQGCSELAQLLRDVRGKKPILAFVEGDACSAAYWLASACDEIVTADTAVLGCLGVQVAYMDDSAWLEKNGLREVIITSSQTPEKNRAPVDDAGKANWQRMCDEMAAVFLDAVASNRGVARSEVDARFGQGAVLVGASAVAAGLADRLSTYEQLHAELTAGGYRSPRSSTTATSARADITHERAIMPPKAKRTAGATAGTPAAAKFEPNAEVRALVTRDIGIAEGDIGSVVEVRDGSFCRVQIGEDEGAVYAWLHEDELEAATAESEDAPEGDTSDEPAAGDGEMPDDEEKPAATRTVSAFQKFVAAAVSAERARIEGILALASRTTLATLAPMIADASCTPHKAAHQLLTSTAKGARSNTLLASLASDEAAIAAAGGLSSVADGAPAEANPIVAALRATNPRALVTPPAHSARAGRGA